MQKYEYTFDVEGHTVVTPAEEPKPEYSPSSVAYMYGIITIVIIGICLAVYLWWFL